MLGNKWVTSLFMYKIWVKRMHFVLLENIFKSRGFFIPFLLVRSLLTENIKEPQRAPQSFLLKVENYPNVVTLPFFKEPFIMKARSRDNRNPNDKEKKGEAISEREISKSFWPLGSS